MKIQTRLSIYSTLVFGVIFIIISVMIYVLYYNNTERAIYQNLSKTAYLTAWFYLEEDELNKEEFAVVKNQFKDEVLNPFYQVYDSCGQITYGAESPAVPAQRLNEIRSKEHLAFTHNDFLCCGIYYEDNQGNFVVITKEKKAAVSERMNILLWILLFALVFGILAVAGLSRWIASIAYKPFTNVIAQVKNISTRNLDVKIESPPTGDELQDLIDTFNDLLQRISETFVIQRNFVSYVSHEFKTPLASALGNLEVFSLKDRTPEEYHELSQKLIKQLCQLEEILNTLLVVSDLAERSEMAAQSRIDELIWEIISKVSADYPHSKILVDIDILPEDESVLMVRHDAAQLLTALYNLIENAVKYSQGKTVDLRIYKSGSGPALSIADKGIGIPPGQLENISRPFYRADNTARIQGSGIGLSIALRIFEKNGIEYHIRSELNKGTEITVIFR